MDPTENLKQQLRIVERISRGDATESDHDRLADLILSLHEWITRGGFLPAQWQPTEDRALKATIRAAIKLDRQKDSGHESEAHEAFRQQMERLVKP